MRHVCSAVCDETAAEVAAAEGAPASRPVPSAEVAALTCHGISVRGLQYFLERYGESISDVTTTSDVCHALVKPATVPAGWVDEATLIDAQKHWYKHVYVGRLVCTCG